MWPAPSPLRLGLPSGSMAAALRALATPDKLPSDRRCLHALLPAGRGNGSTPSSCGAWLELRKHPLMVNGAGHGRQHQLTSPSSAYLNMRVDDARGVPVQLALPASMICCTPSERAIRSIDTLGCCSHQLTACEPFLTRPAVPTSSHLCPQASQLVQGARGRAACMFLLSARLRRLTACLWLAGGRCRGCLCSSSV